MKNTKTMIVAALMGLTIAASANANNLTYNAEEKGRVVILNKALPASLPVLESPAPLKEKLNVDTNKHTAAQKAAIVGLQLKSTATK
jgi:hypothetical protein